MNKVDEILALIDEGLATAEAVEKEFGRVPERGEDLDRASNRMREIPTLRIPEGLREELNAHYNQLLWERLLPSSITIRPSSQGDILDGITGLYRDEMERQLLLNYDETRGYTQ